MSQPILITEIMGEIVTATMNSIITKSPDKTLLETIIANERAALGKTLIQTIDYQHGHKIELIETLYQMDRGENKFKKYPLFYLVQDFTEDRGKIPGIYAATSLNIIIAHHTKDTFKIGERQENVFKPVLYPIYNAFLKALSKSKWVTVGNMDMIPHKKTDRSYWGRNAVGGTDATKLDDCVDALEIENLQLNFNFKNC